MGAGIHDSFEHYFARSIVNDNGEPLSLETGYIIVSEWRKLMFVNAVEITHEKKKGRMDKDQNKK